MMYEHGVEFVVTSCSVVDLYWFLVCGQPIDSYGTSSIYAHFSIDSLALDAALIKGGVLYPKEDNDKNRNHKEPYRYLPIECMNCLARHKEYVTCTVTLSHLVDYRQQHL